MLKLPLHEGWMVRAVGDVARVPQAVRERDVPAIVPGCVTTDLLAAGLIEDPYLDHNDLQQTWIGRTDWRYTCRFKVTPDALAHERVDLVCDGLDTIATVELNGQVIGRAESMHIGYRFDAKPAIKSGDNELAITFAAPLPYAQAMEARLGKLPHTGHGTNPPHPHNMIRKMACNFGWDWGPDVATSGIWRPIRLEAWSGTRIRTVRPHVTLAAAGRAVVQLRVEIDGGHRPTATLTSPSRRQYEADEALRFDVADPELWWPRGYGEQPLYTLRVTAGDDTWTRKIGIRTVELVTDPDPSPVAGPVDDLGQGSTMHLRINGKRVWCKGANWIPDDCFPTRVTAARYRHRIQQACDANMNMLRVWGGGAFESETFYEICDELGVMVWQDFLCACACYPEEEPFRTLITREAEYNVARLAAHPSLVLWNGCNENIWGTFAWGPDWVCLREEGKRTWGLGYYLDIFPRIVETHGAGTPYWPASPYSGSMDLHPNLNEHGNRHIWDVWHGPGQYRNYLAHYPRFASEFGYHGPPCWPTLDRAIPADQRTWDSPAMKHHNKNGGDGQAQTHLRMQDDFLPPPHEAFDDWLYLAQVMQGRALSMGVEWFRALNPWCSGALIWQLNDCWPVSSWSMIDGDGRLKPLWYVARHFFAPRLVTIKTRKVTPMNEQIGLLAAYLHNDCDEVWAGTLRLRRLSLEGDMIDTHEQAIRVEPRASSRVLIPDHWHDRPDAMLVADVGSHRGTWWFSSDKELDYPAPAFDTGLTHHGDEHRLSIAARGILRDVCVFADRLDPDATVSDQLVTLLPGESHTFVIRSRHRLDADALTRPPVLQMANRFGIPAAAAV
jgi:beta-mannosidase